MFFGVPHKRTRSGLVGGSVAVQMTKVKGELVETSTVKTLDKNAA
jgi:hypothetical protein